LQESAELVRRGFTGLELRQRDNVLLAEREASEHTGRKHASATLNSFLDVGRHPATRPPETRQPHLPPQPAPGLGLNYAAAAECNESRRGARRPTPLQSGFDPYRWRVNRCPAPPAPNQPTTHTHVPVRSYCAMDVTRARLARRSTKHPQGEPLSKELWQPAQAAAAEYYFGDGAAGQQANALADGTPADWSTGWANEIDVTANDSFGASAVAGGTQHRVRSAPSSITLDTGLSLRLNATQIKVAKSRAGTPATPGGQSRSGTPGASDARSMAIRAVVPAECRQRSKGRQASAEGVAAAKAEGEQGACPARGTAIHASCLGKFCTSDGLSRAPCWRAQGFRRALPATSWSARSSLV
jgi:hypothetical protein